MRITIACRRPRLRGAPCTGRAGPLLGGALRCSSTLPMHLALANLFASRPWWSERLALLSSNTDLLSQAEQSDPESWVGSQALVSLVALACSAKVGLIEGTLKWTGAA